MVRLGVNIDHVATLRQQRGENYPSISRATKAALEGGADQITIHLREDRRHIQDSDVLVVKEITDQYKRPLNLEMGCSKEIEEIALTILPSWVCLVPEKREEKTTEGGLDLLTNTVFEKVSKTVEMLKNRSQGQIKISLFLEAKETILEKISSLPIDAVEIHTGEYAKNFLEKKDISFYFEQFLRAKELVSKYPIGFHAGHGLTLESTIPLLKKKLFEEYNIGHFIIGEAIFNGLENVVKEFKMEFLKH